MNAEGTVGSSRLSALALRAAERVSRVCSFTASSSFDKTIICWHTLRVNARRLVHAEAASSEPKYLPPCKTRTLTHQELFFPLLFAHNDRTIDL